MNYGFSGDGDAKFRALGSYLDRLRGTRPMPARADIRPEDMPPGLLPDLFMIDVQGDSGPGCQGPWRYRYRLVGTRVASATGADWTGRPVDADLLGERLQGFLDAYDECVRARRPTVRPHRFMNLRDGTAHRARRYLFPLSTDGSRIDVLLGLLAIEPEAPRD